MASKFLNIDSNAIKIIDNKLIIDLQYTPLDSNNSYEIVVPSGSIKDSIGNDVISSPVTKVKTGQGSPIGFDIFHNVPYDNSIKVSVNPEIGFIFNKEWHIANIRVDFGEFPNYARRSPLTIWSEWNDVNLLNRQTTSDIEIFKKSFWYYPVPHHIVDPETYLPSYDSSLTCIPEHKIANALEYNTKYRAFFTITLDPSTPDPIHILHSLGYNLRLHLIFTTAAENEQSYPAGTGIAGSESCLTRTGGTGGVEFFEDHTSKGLAGDPGLWTFCHEKGGTGGTGGTGGYY